MLSRRSFLVGTGTITLTQLLAGCSNSQDRLKVLLLQGSIPPQLVNEFRQQISGKGLDFKPEAQLKDLFSLLQTWQQHKEGKKTPFNWMPFAPNKPTALVDLVTLGDYWLVEAIQKKLIQPLQISNLAGWKQLSPRWQMLVKRNNQGELAENGLIWGAPYRWGTTVIAYRQDKFEKLGWTPTDWKDLWHPKLRDRISLLNQPREVIGLTLKKLGYSYNSPDLTQIPHLKSELLALQKQVKFYSSDYYLQSLILGDTWLSVGWSSDVLAIQPRYSDIKAIIPKSGTSLWADLWVKPASLQETKTQFSLANQWINFCWQSQATQSISLLTNATSPLILSMKANELPKQIRDNPLLLVNTQILEKSEFLFPLSHKTQQQYQDLWQEIRKSGKG